MVLTRRTRALAAWIAVVLAVGLVAAPDRRPVERTSLGTEAAAARSAPRRAPAALRPSSTTTTTVASTVLSTTTSTSATPRSGFTVTRATGRGAGGGTPLPAGTPTSGPTTVTGVVRDQHGRPVANACVELLNDSRFDKVGDWVTGPDGAWSATYQLQLESQDARVTVRDCSGAVPGFGQAGAQVRTFPLQSHRLDVTVTPGAVVRGTVVDDDFHQVDGTGLCAWVDTDTAGRVSAPVTAHGTFVIVGVPAQRTSLYVGPSCDALVPLSDWSGTILPTPGSDQGYIVVIPHSERSKPSTGPTPPVPG